MKSLASWVLSFGLLLVILFGGSYLQSHAGPGLPKNPLFNSSSSYDPDIPSDTRLPAGECQCSMKEYREEIAALRDRIEALEASRFVQVRPAQSQGLGHRLRVLLQRHVRNKLHQAITDVLQSRCLHHQRTNLLHPRRCGRPSTAGQLGHQCHWRADRLPCQRRLGRSSRHPQRPPPCLAAGSRHTLWPRH